MMEIIEKWREKVQSEWVVWHHSLTTYRKQIKHQMREVNMKQHNKTNKKN